MHRLVEVLLPVKASRGAVYHYRKHFLTFLISNHRKVSLFCLQTYCVDSQVADSACSATAYLGGVKANIGTIGVTAKVKLNDCNGMRNVSNQVTSILKWSQVTR
jgi:alkaline phosphatase